MLVSYPVGYADGSDHDAMRTNEIRGRSAAIAANLAKGMDVHGAVKAACRYVEAGIRTAPGFGKGHGPLNHFHSMQMLPFVP